MNSSPYSISLLNDLHHFFPDLLYRSERFQTVQDVLQYVAGVAQENPYERERRRYRVTIPLLEPEEQEQGQDQEQDQEQDQDQKQEREQEQEQEQDQEPNEEKEYHFTVSSSGYSLFPSVPSASTPPSSSASSSSSPSILSSAMDQDSLFRALLEPRTIARPSSRFRLSVPLDLTSFLSSPLSSSYFAPAPSSLHSLSQLSDLLRPVIIRPTEQHLAENTYVYCSEVPHQENCAICQDPMEAGQETRTILACSHCFHRECIDRWFQEHVRCPTCRRDVREP